MPYGKGTYGSRVGRPKKNNYQLKRNKKKIRIVMGNKNTKAKKRKV